MRQGGAWTPGGYMQGTVTQCLLPQTPPLMSTRACLKAHQATTDEVVISSIKSTEISLKVQAQHAPSGARYAVPMCVELHASKDGTHWQEGHDAFHIGPNQPLLEGDTTVTAIEGQETSVRFKIKTLVTSYKQRQHNKIRKGPLKVRYIVGGQTRVLAA